MMINRNGVTRESKDSIEPVPDTGSLFLVCAVKALRTLLRLSYARAVVVVYQQYECLDKNELKSLNFMHKSGYDRPQYC